MRAFFSTGVLAFTLALSGCSTSHGGDSDGGGGGDGGGSGGDGSVGSTDGSAGSTDGTTGFSDASVGSSDGSGGTGIDLVESCVAVCDYLVACHPMFDRVECVSDCLGTRGWLSSPMCEALTVELFDCVLTLDCAELLDEDISTSICGPTVRELERECGDDGTRPDDPPSVEPPPAP